MQAQHELVVEFAGVRGRGPGVKDIAGDDHCIDLLLGASAQQPVDQRLVFGLTAFAHEMLAQMPVGGVQQAHGLAARGKGREFYRSRRGPSGGAE